MLIGLVGRRGTGKDTIANHLVCRHGFRHRKFSGPLKEALKALFGLTDEHMEGVLKEIPHPLWGVSPRMMMQFFGTDVMQTHIQELIPRLGKGHAVQRLLMEMNLDLESKTDTVVSDVRFQHEVDALLSRGALLIRVKRIGHLQHHEVVDAHESEAGVDMLFSNVEVCNDGTLESLLRSVDCLVEKFDCAAGV